jgi:hypothetical protein
MEVFDFIGLRSTNEPVEDHDNDPCAYSPPNKHYHPGRTRHPTFTEIWNVVCGCRSSIPRRRLKSSGWDYGAFDGLPDIVFSSGSPSYKDNGEFRSVTSLISSPRLSLPATSVAAWFG